MRNLCQNSAFVCKKTCKKPANFLNYSDNKILSRPSGDKAGKSGSLENRPYPQK